MNSRIIFSTTQNFDVFAPNVFICIHFSYFKSCMVFYHMGMPWLHPCHWIFKLFQLFNIIEFRINILTDTHLYTQPPWFSHILFFWKSHPWHWAHPSLMVPWVLIVSSLWEALASPVSLLCTLSLAGLSSKHSLSSNWSALDFHISASSPDLRPKFLLIDICTWMFHRDLKKYV